MCMIVRIHAPLRRCSMTQPRRHIAGQVVYLSRRCFQRKFFLRPDSFINRVLFYEMARASGRHGQVVHGAMAMSTFANPTPPNPASHKCRLYAPLFRRLN